MPRLWTAVVVIAAAALGLAPAAQATVTSSTIDSWTSSQPGTPASASYLVSYDNPTATKLTLTGHTNGRVGDHVSIDCFWGTAPNTQVSTLVGNLPVHSDGSFTTLTGSSAPQLKTVFSDPTKNPHGCRLRAVPTDWTDINNVSQFAGPQVAISRVGLPSAIISGKPFDFYAVGQTFTAYAGWSSAGSCGPYAAPMDSGLNTANVAIDCVGSLLGSDARVSGSGHRSEVQVDGQDAYDAASAQAVFNGTEDPSSSFPQLAASVDSDPTDGLAASQSTEGWVVCASAVSYPPTSITCPHFASAGVQLQRNIVMSDGGLVVTMTDTWSSIDQKPHSLDLLYDDVVGLKTSSAQRGYEFPGQSAFSAYGQGASLPAPGAGPDSILVRSNVAASDGDPSEAAGAITFATPPSGFTFVGNNEFEEHRVLQVPAGGSASVTYIYSTAYTVAQVKSLALAAQDRLQPMAVSITSPANGATTSTASVMVTGVATAGSGISSLAVAGQTVPVEPDGAWSANVTLNPGSNTISVLASDAAGATAQGQVTVVYQPPPAPLPPPPVGPAGRCTVPRTKGMKLPAAERALRRAHCKVGKIKHVRSKKIAPGRVMSTTPRAGRRLAAGAKVALFVSKGA